MRASQTARDSAQVAGIILDAMKDGRLDALEAALNRAESLDAAGSSLVPDERDELLAAIARQIHAGLRRLQRQRTAGTAACPAHLGLLRHLAGEHW